MSLFGAIPANACAAYTGLRDGTHAHQQAGRAHCDDLWRDFAPLADANFVAEFPIRLHERWFEMYLTVAFLRAGLNVTCPKPGPDILLTLAGGTRIWIEATCATPGQPGLPDSVPPPQFVAVGAPAVVTSRPTEQMALRIRNAVSAKEAVFRGYVTTGIVAATDVQVIAVNVHAVHGLWADMGDLMMRSLYGVGDMVLTLDRSTGTVVDQRHAQLTHIAKKSTGATVGVQPFIDGNLPHVSAIIGSRADAVNLPGRRLGDDLTLFPNLTGSVAWPAGTVPLGEEWSFTQGIDGWDGKLIGY